MITMPFLKVSRMRTVSGTSQVDLTGGSRNIMEVEMASVQS